MKSFKTYMTELFDFPIDFKHAGLRGYPHIYEFTISDYTYTAGFTQPYDERWNIGFAMTKFRGQKCYLEGITGVGPGIAIRVLSTIVKIAIDFAKKNNPEVITFTADKKDGKRSILYNQILKRNITSEYKYITTDEGDKIRFTIVRK